MKELSLSFNWFGIVPPLAMLLIEIFADDPSNASPSKIIKGVYWLSSGLIIVPL